jgi:hypothetical protein
MSISWAQGLLAGASGVAEYSKQEQQRKQKRLDRTNDLKNQMALLQSKSKYATKIKEYETNRATLKALEGLQEGSYEEQFMLYKDKGLKDEVAHTLATANMKKGKLQARPKSMAMPKLLLPTPEEGVAKSPLGEWASNFSRSLRSDETNELQRTSARTGSTEPTVPEIPSSVDPTMTAPTTVNPEGLQFGAMATPGSGNVGSIVDSTSQEAMAALYADDPKDPKDPTIRQEERSDPDNPDKTITVDVARHKQTGEILWESPVKSRLSEEAKRKLDEEKNQFNKKKDTVDADLSEQQINTMFNAGTEGDNFVDYSGSADTPFNMRFPNLLSNRDEWNDSLDPLFDNDDKAKQAARGMSKVMQTYRKAELAKIDKDVLSQDTAGTVARIEREAEAEAIVGNLEPQQIVQALLTDDDELFTISPDLFKGKPATKLRGVITY